MSFRHSSFVLSICIFWFTNSAVHSQDPDFGQWIPHLEISEQAAVAPILGIAADPSKVSIGPCYFIRANSTWTEYLSWAEAFQHPEFAFEKFPKRLQRNSEFGFSRKHPIKIIAKSRVGSAMFFFEESVQFPEESEPPVHPVPTDFFNMTISKANAQIKLKRNFTKIITPKTKAGHTAYKLQIRHDGPNKTTRSEPVDINHKYRLAFYFRKRDGTWSKPMVEDCQTQSVTVSIYNFHIPHEYAVNGKYTMRGVIEVARWARVPAGNPGAPGLWNDWKKMPGSQAFLKKLDKSVGKEHRNNEDNRDGGENVK